MVGIEIALLLSGAALLAGCGKGPAPAEVQTGKQLYDFYCVECHQNTGVGAFLRWGSPVRYTKLTYRKLVYRILGHSEREDSGMPAFEISKSQAEAIAIHIRRKLKAE